MKVILNAVAIVLAIGAAIFSLTLSGKIKSAIEARDAAVDKEKTVSARIAATNKEIADETARLTAGKEQQILETANLSALKSTGANLERDFAEVDRALKAQEAEFAEMEQSLLSVTTLMKDLGDDVSIDTITGKIQEMGERKEASSNRLEELQTLTETAEKTLEANRVEAERASQRVTERQSRISRNSTEAVITAVNQEWGFLVIGAGSNSGFTPQTELLVKRDGRYLGKVKPSSIEPTQTIAEIDLESLAPGVRLQAGDRVILAEPAAN